MSNKFNILVTALLEASKSKDWEVAKKEWKPTEIYFVDTEDMRGEANYETCSCSHYPIKEVITITNTLNQNSMKVGNCCINKIIGDDTENKKLNSIFKALKTKKINKSLIEQAYYNDLFINEWEYNFLKNVWRKKGRTEKQTKKLNDIKDRIMGLYALKYGYHDPDTRTGTPGDGQSSDIAPI